MTQCLVLASYQSELLMTHVMQLRCHVRTERSNWWEEKVTDWSLSGLLCDSWVGEAMAVKTNQKSIKWMRQDNLQPVEPVFWPKSDLRVMYWVSATRMPVPWCFSKAHINNKILPTPTGLSYSVWGVEFWLCIDILHRLFGLAFAFVAGALATERGRGRAA